MIRGPALTPRRSGRTLYRTIWPSRNVLTGFHPRGPRLAKYHQGYWPATRSSRRRKRSRNVKTACAHTGVIRGSSALDVGVNARRRGCGFDAALPVDLATRSQRCYQAAKRRTGDDTQQRQMREP
jgi:hypothetical protein